MDKIPISEIYTAVQGEGRFRTPAIFVRVFGCNLRCRYNGTSCDTPYAVLNGTKTLMTIEELANKIIGFGAENNIEHVVFTGGEPLLFQKIITRVIKQLPIDYFTEVETNGTISPSTELQIVVGQFNVSPKLKSSNQSNVIYDSVRENYKVSLRDFSAGQSTLKIVVKDETDMDEVMEISNCNPGMEVTLMPMGETRKQLLKNIPIVMDLCLKHGFGFTNRDHILAFGKERKK